MEPVRVAVVGTGFMGSQHAEAYDRHPLAELVALVDVRGEIASGLARRYGVEAFTNTQTMLEECDIGAVSICTNDDQHVEPTLACLGAERHVLLEKPIATTIEDADLIIQAAGHSTAKFLVGQIVRFEPRYRHVKERVASGELGELEAVFARRLNHMGSQDILQGRVSVLSFLAVHDFDYLLWLTGSKPVRLFTESVAKIHKARGFDVEDHTFTLIRFDDDVIGCVEAGWILPNTHPRRADFKLEVIGTRGMAEVDMLSEGLVVGSDRGWETPSVGNMLDLEISHFMDCILNDRSPLVTGAEAREALRLSLAAQESVRSEKVIDL